MNKLFNKSLPVLIVLILSGFIFCSSGVAGGQKFKTETVVEFVRDNLPRVRGQVVQIKDDIYVEVRGDTRAGKTEIYRTIVSQAGGEIVKERKNLGRGKLELLSGGIGRLIVNSEVREKIKVGDQFRNIPRQLFLDLPADAKELPEKLSALSGIRAVKNNQPAENNEDQYLLTVREGQLQLLEGEDQLLARQRFKTEASGEPAVEMIKVDTLPRKIQDLVWVKNGSNSAGGREKLFLAAGGAVGIGQIENNKVKIERWHTIPGQVLSLSAGKNYTGKNNSPVHSFLAVYSRDNKIRTVHLSYNLEEQSIEEDWRDSNVWIEKGKAGFYGLKIGLSDPAGGAFKPVEISDGGWEWSKGDTRDLPVQTLPTAFQADQNRLWRLNEPGKLEIFQQGKNIYTTTSTYGGRPFELSARQGPKKVVLHPGFIVRKLNEREKILVPDNRPEGISFFRSLQGYSASRLYLLEFSENNIETLWESERFPGYISGLVEDPRGWTWMLQVEDEKGMTNIYKVENF
ncbi:MAG: hypothetical protein ACQEP7_05620 [bacterium]